MGVNHAQNRLVVIGAPRSGTTLLRRLLNGHPEVACPPETYLLTAAARFLHSEPIADGGRLGVTSGLSDAGFCPDEVRTRLREFTFSFLSEYAASRKATRWAEKTASNVYHLDRIEELCGDEVTYICIVRHGLDVATSMSDLAGRSQAYLSELHSYIQRFARPLEAFCHAWVDACRAIRSLAERRPEHVITLRYEDLIDDSDFQMSRIAEFIGTHWEPRWGQEALRRSDDAGLGDWKTYRQSEISSASKGRWKKLSPMTQSELAPIVNETLVDWNYPPLRTRTGPSETEAQRRYRLALRLSSLVDQ